LVKARVRLVERVTEGIKSDWRCATRTGLAWVEDERTDDGTERKRGRRTRKARATRSDDYGLMGTEGEARPDDPGTA
jgi:hypothetical protein